MAKYKVELTGVNTSNLKVLTSEETKNLFIKMKDGDKFAREELIKGNLKLVLSILKRFNSKGENMDDLFQIGCVGLVKAIDNFDIDLGVQLSTYAVPMILGEVKRYLRDNNPVRVSRSIKDTAYKVLKEKERLTMENGVEPTNSELAKILGIEEYDIVVALESLISPVSLFEPIYNDGGDTIYLFDQVEDKKSNCDVDMKVALEKAINKLSKKEQFILENRFFVGKTQMEIASEIGISQAQISRLEKGALKRIRKQL